MSVLACALFAVGMTACGSGGDGGTNAALADFDTPTAAETSVADTAVDLSKADDASVEAGASSPVHTTQVGQVVVVDNSQVTPESLAVASAGKGAGGSLTNDISAPASAAASSAAAAASTINTVDTVVNDMKLKNDLVLRGYEDKTVGWYVGPGHVMMGNDPRLSNTPSWWKASNPGRANGEYLRAMLPWVVIFDGVGHKASNTRVHIRNFRAFYKSKSSGKWVSLGSSAGAEGAVYGKSTLFGATTAEQRRTNADGSSEIKPPDDGNYAWHGWWNKGRISIEPTDIAALFVTLQARLVVDDPSRPDDRANARFLIQVGNDYYKDTKTNWSFIIPSSMTSRSKLVTTQWQAFSATTFSNVGAQEPGGGITEAEFRASPPPLE